MYDSIVFDAHAQQLLKSGVKKITDAVSITLGPRGKLVLIEKIGEPPHLTKDGATVAKHVELSDRVEQLGAKLLKQASENTASSAGDGSTTSTVLAKEIYFAADKALQTGVGSPSELTVALTRKVEDIIELLSTKKREVSSNDEIKQVACISANGDEYIGNLIANAMSEVGSSGLVTVEKSKTTQTELRLVKGIKVERGYVSPYFVNQEDKSKCVLEDPVVLIISSKLNSLTQILPVLEKAHQASKPVFIVANDYDQEAIQSLIANVSKGLLDVCAIRSPFYGEKRNQILTDLANALGTEVIYDLDEKSIESLGFSSLGTCKKIEINNHETIFVECPSTKNDDEVAHKIEKDLENKNINKEEEAYLKQRLVINKGVVAVLSIGANTESELLELVDRIDDALHATKAAIESGFLPGGGISLAKSGIELLKEEDTEKPLSLLDKTVNKVLSDACMAPFKKILKNADLSSEYIFEMIKKSENWEDGYDVRSDQYVNMIDSGIIDPFKVTTTALRNAVSVANSLLSVGCVVLHTESSNNQVQLVHLSDDMY